MKINSVSLVRINNNNYHSNKKSSKPCLSGNFCTSNPLSYGINYYINQISFGKKGSDFSSIDEANEYFYKKYGAMADFSSIEQAKTMDYAIKDFLSKTKIKNKKFLNNVLISSAEADDDSPLKIAANIKYGYNLDDETAELYKAYESAGKVKEFIDVFKPEVVKCNVLRLGLILNNCSNWDENHLEENTAEIQDKLITLIHLKNSPFDYVIKNRTATNRAEKRIMAEVGDDLNKNDFIEQYVIKRLKGETFSAEVTNLYREFGGANLFGDWVDYDFAGVRFTSLTDAKKYFRNEYGIMADFTSLEQAYTVKMAIDDFLKLSTIKDKKFLNGVKIEIKDKLEGTNPDVGAEVCPLDYECVYNSDVSKIFKKYQSEGRESEFFEENRPDEINVRKIVLCLKSDYGWEAKPKGKTYMADTSRKIIHHEIGHILHLKNEPWQFFKNYNKKALSKSEYEIMKKVTSYATTSRLEFVAEYISNRISGKTFDDDVIKLYRELGGPNIFNDW